MIQYDKRMMDGLRRPVLPLRIGWALVVSCGLVVACFFGSASLALATEGTAPTITGVSVTVSTEYSATVVAQINPEGSETAYEFRLVRQDASPSGPGEPVAGGPQAQSGHIPAGVLAKSVSATLTGLQPSYTYWYTITAINSAGRTVGEYILSVRSASAELAELESAETIKEYEARLLQEANEHKEREVREAANRAAEGVALNQRVAEEVEEEAVARRPACSVPSLKGDTLKKARRELAEAHCRLGNIILQRHHHGLLIVTAQTRRRGNKLAGGAAIGVTLGSKQPRRRQPPDTHPREA
jgi:hypothetical protein